MSITSTAFAQKRVAIIQIILPALLQDMRADDSVLFRTPWAILTTVTSDSDPGSSPASRGIHPCTDEPGRTSVAPKQGTRASHSCPERTSRNHVASHMLPFGPMARFRGFRISRIAAPAQKAIAAIMRKKASFGIFSQ